MPLPTGFRLGPYEISSAIGAGGMGEVYRARDTKLGRDVALKVLPQAFARDADRMARFQREAKVLASLNHPNIASIYGLEDSGSTHALVMELVEGPTLADRIRQGPIPVEEALRIAKQVCDALEYAHERGIVHRDLKPANVKVTADDAVKVLDFGLAKALEGDAASIDISTSPTISRMATQAGILLGTAAYMSPEQAKGKSVDRRADIWAFGCVLYELLTGKRAFDGETVTDTLAAVIRAEPDWPRLPAATPMRVRVLLQRCLQKDPKQRLRDIGDARISLDEVLSGAPDLAPVGGAEVPVVPLWRRVVLWSAGLLAVALASVSGWILKPTPSPPPRPVMRFTISLPPGQRMAGLGQPALALSPDGSRLAYVASQGDSAQQIYVRAMDSGEAKPIFGTEGATAPFFSPDGQWLGFFADGKLKKIGVNGGVAQPLTDASVLFRGAAWGSQGAIVLSTVGPGLQEIRDTGGSPRPLNQTATGEGDQSWPDFLPGSKAVLYCAETTATIAVQPIGAGERRNLIQGNGNPMPRYAPSGHLIYAQAGNLMAVPFDLDRLQVKGDVVPVVQGVLQSRNFPGAAQYSVSATGSLVYVPGNLAATVQSRLVWVSRNGTEHALAAPVGAYDFPRLSPDGRRVAVGVSDGRGGGQISLYDLARDTLTRFTFEGILNVVPVWTPDGKHVAFLSSKEGSNVFWQLADGSGGLEQLTDNSSLDVPFSWSPDGQLLAFDEIGSAGRSIFVLRMSDRKEQPFLQSKALLDAPQFSPDGRWLAYVSDESGRREVYVQPYPGPGGKWQISTDGGTEPQWNHNGRELFYRVGDKMMAVDISTQPGFDAGKPRQLFEGRYLMNSAGEASADYDVSADGQRFLMLKPAQQEQAAPTQINVVLNWTEELKRLVPTGK